MELWDRSPKALPVRVVAAATLCASRIRIPMRFGQSQTLDRCGSTKRELSESHVDLHSLHQLVRA